MGRRTGPQRRGREEPRPSDYEPLAPPSQDYYYDNATNTQDLTDALRLAAEEGTIGSDLWERAMAMSQDETRRPQEHTVPDAGPARTFESPSPQPQEPRPAQPPRPLPKSSSPMTRSDEAPAGSAPPRQQGRAWLPRRPQEAPDAPPRMSLPDVPRGPNRPEVGAWQTSCGRRRTMSAR
ncbi:hypothetical protein [Nesterenkonia pannonica]|uniref:hypothetical protein n=1 Tax=Nesterenkonia pannonica TaxID=1548602 RepID=UPI002164510B|nr:hypothetical protein [Nesterenkonia pannonica]